MNGDIVLLPIKELLPWTAIAANALVKSEVHPANPTVRALSLMRFEISWMPVGTATPTAGCEFRIEGNLADSGETDAWHPLTSFVTNILPATALALDQAQAAGTGDAAAPILETATTGLAAIGTEYVGFAHATIGLSEIQRVVALVTNTSFTLFDALQNAHALAEAYYTKAEKFNSTDIEGSPGALYRVVVYNNFGATAVVGRARVRMREVRST